MYPDINVRAENAYRLKQAISRLRALQRTCALSRELELLERTITFSTYKNYAEIFLKK